MYMVKLIIVSTKIWLNIVLMLLKIVSKLLTNTIIMKSMKIEDIIDSIQSQLDEILPVLTS
jgi:hypothetical protein